MIFTPTEAVLHARNRRSSPLLAAAAPHAFLPAASQASPIMQQLARNAHALSSSGMAWRSADTACKADLPIGRRHSLAASPAPASKPKSFYQDLANGVISGTIEVVILQPMLYMKTATQANLPFSTDLRVLYRGVETSVLNMAIMTGIQFPLFSAVKKVVTGGDRAATDAEIITSAFLGGGISGVVCGPLELTMINQMSKKGHSLVSMSAHLVRSYGPTIMTRGMVTACGREAMFAAGYIGLGPVLTAKFKEQGLNAATSMVAGAVIAGIFSSYASHPLDTIKTKMQEDPGRERFRTLRHTASEVLKEKGVRGFYSGATWRTGRMILAVFIIGRCKEFLEEHFHLPF